MSIRTNFIMALNKYNDFVEEEETLRKNAPEYDKDGALLITGKAKDDTIRYHNLNYIHPDSDMLDAMTPIMLKAFRGEDVSENLGEAVKESFGVDLSESKKTKKERKFSLQK